MKISITFSKKFRQNLVIAFNFIRSILVIVGIIMTLVFATGLDAPGDIGVYATKAVIVCLGMVLIGMFLEIFTVTFLIHEGEHILTIFDFNFYGLKSRANYMEYRRYLNETKNTKNVLNNTTNNSNVYNIRKSL